MVYEHLFEREVLKFDGDDHKIILLLIDTMEIGVSEGDGGHSASVVEVSCVVDGLDSAKVFLPS